jgi:hypothetical protein
MRTRPLLLASFPLLAALGCHTEAPIDPKASADEAASRAADVVRQAGAGLSFLGDDGGVLGKMFSSADDASHGLMMKALPAPLPRPLIRNLQGSPVVKSMAGVDAIGSFLTADEQFDETAHDVEVLLRDRLLVASNIESKTDSEVTYLLKPEPTCRPLPSSGGPSEPDAGCVRDLPKLQVRLVTRTDGDGLRLTVLVGPARNELSAFVVHSDLLAWEVDFASGLRAVEFVNATLAPNEPKKPYPFTRLEGRIKLAVQKLGEKKVKASFGILQPVAITADDPDSGFVSFSSAKSDPLFAITGDGVNKQAVVTVAVGQTEVTTPWDPSELGAKNADQRVSVGGLYGEATLTEGKKEVAFRGMGIGQTFVAVRGTHLFDLDFNPADGRRFDLLVKVGADDQPRFEVTPRFDLSLAFNLAAVAGELKNQPPSYLLHETYTVRLDGATPAVIEPARANDVAGFPGGLRVTAGTLTLATSANASATVTVPAGQCLTGKSPVPAGAHELLGALAAVPCP